MLVKPYIKIYQGYGSPSKFFIIGHVLNNYQDFNLDHKSNIWNNFKTLYKLFSISTLPNFPLTLYWKGQTYPTTSEQDGFFKFEIDVEEHLLEKAVGWQEFVVRGFIQDSHCAVHKGQFYIPEEHSLSVISDIDDTIVKSYSTKTYKKLMELMNKNATERKTFERVSDFLTMFQRRPFGVPYNFFYVSSSEWNLYDYIKHVFRSNKIPDGILLLNTIKSLKEFTKTGYTGHEGKFFRIARLFISFPQMKFLLIGDNSQRDVYIYSSIAQKYPDQILGILIRNVRKSKTIPTDLQLKELTGNNILCFQFNDTQEAIDKCEEWGLVTESIKQVSEINS